MSNAEKEFEKFWEDKTVSFSIDKKCFEQFAKQAFTAGVEHGRNSMLAEMREKWPSKTEFDDYFFTPKLKSPVDIYNWLKTKLFGDSCQ